ncbi:MAG: hypothetical protein AAGC85_01220 [Bacteroidota bacterium]
MSDEATASIVPAVMFVFRYNAHIDQLLLQTRNSQLTTAPVSLHIHFRQIHTFK